MRDDMLHTLATDPLAGERQVALDVRRGQGAKILARRQCTVQKVGDGAVVMLDRLAHQSAQLDEVSSVLVTQLRERLVDCRGREASS
jgi:hypothetical protein